METPKSKPELRFKSVNQIDYPHWETKELKQVVSINPSVENLPEEFIYIDLESVEQGTILKENKIKRSEAPSRAQRSLKKNDILFQTVRPYQKNNLLFKNEGVYVASTGYAQLRTNANADFLYHYLHTDKFLNQVLLRCTGSNYPAINSSELATIKVMLPHSNEQLKIASFLTAIDNKIQQLKKKKNLLEQYKKGMMQLLFTQQVFFKDNNEDNYPDWEECTAKDYFKSVSNKNHNSDLPILAVTQDKGVVKRDEIDIKIYSSEASIKSYKVVEPGDFIISLRSFQGGIELSNIKGICSPAYTILKPTQKIDSNFFKIYLKKEDFIKRLSSAVIGIRDGKQISFSAFADIQLRVPALEEQQKIAAFINSIEQKIEIIQTQITQTQNFKKGLLQQMFV